MDKERKKAKRLVIVIFLFYFCLALVCFGICAYLVVTGRREEVVNENVVTFSKIAAMGGIFFLVVAFGHILLPVLAASKSGKTGDAQKTGAAAVFDEANMRRALEKYIPAGETLTAGIHAIAKETEVNCVFTGCVCAQDRLIPAQDGGVLALSKKKYLSHDIYIGMTQHFLVMTDCEKEKYYYEFDRGTDAGQADVQEVTADILLDDVGKCFRLADIQSCEIKDGWLGSVNCLIRMKNESLLKLMFPKLGGLGTGMLHHAQYRDEIIMRLRS